MAFVYELRYDTIEEFSDSCSA